MVHPFQRGIINLALIVLLITILDLITAAMILGERVLLLLILLA